MRKMTRQDLAIWRVRIRVFIASKEYKAKLNETLERIATTPPRVREPREPFDPNKLYGKIETPTP